ncbi:MAG TPA: endopeptidase La [Thermodesulfovibrionales bacterium]|nr:endopeptidase La [Thermodesulfovibrionales bacterium]
MNFFRSADRKLQTATVEQLRGSVASVPMPLHVRQIADRELEILAKLNPSAAEYGIGLTYVEYLLDLPWNSRTEDNLDLARAEKILNERHYGLDAVKDRILEHLAVKIMIRNRKPRVLVVDDEEVARKNLEHVLRKEDYSVVTAADGAEAIGILATSEFDAVLTDLRMERVSGIDLLEKVKIKHPETKVIVITAYASVESAIEAMKKGAFHYITKPFKLDEVRSVLRQAFETRVPGVSTKGLVLCFAGPPGTGKTSLGRSVAEALGRKFGRISLGGIKDEAEIRGHRRTYAGAMPGRLVEEIRRAQVLNPVIVFDEVDKIGQDFKGDSASALLEVLDPEQNRGFIDHYLDLSFDLSHVMFIMTANVADAIQEPLRDRMEVLEFSGYTEDEKIQIALQYLVPKQVQAKGLSDCPPEFTSGAVSTIIRDHTREAGVRNLEREIASVCRKMAMTRIRRGDKAEPCIVTSEEIGKYLGPRKYLCEVADEKNRVGVVTGLVWTEVGGDIVFVETAKMKGSKELILTGSLGNVMRESAQTALSYVRSNAASFSVPEDFFDGHDIHIHVPAGAIPKDGPSAGATITVALVSLVKGQPARRDAAVSGEMTLSGRMLPVGGIKEKILAARRAGVRAVFLPAGNRVDVENLSNGVRGDLEIHLADRIEEVVEKVLIENENAEMSRP